MDDRIPYCRVTTTIDLPISIELAAKWFANLDDDSQARFFVEVAKIAETWDFPLIQWHNLGGHLKNCSCSTEAAREMIRHIAYAIEHSEHGASP